MDIWIVGCHGDEQGWTFLGAYATEEEVAAVLADSEWSFAFPWALGRPMDEYGWPGGLEGFRWCEKVVERDKREQESAERRAAEALIPRPPVEHEVIRNDDGSTTVRVKPTGESRRSARSPRGSQDNFPPI